jgi:hypothetical protein
VTRRFAFIAVSLAVAWACQDDEKPPPPGHHQPEAGEGGTRTSGGTGTGGSKGGSSSGLGGSGQGGTQSGAAGADEPGGIGGENPGGSAGTETGGTAGTGPPPPCPSEANMDPPPTGTFVCDPEGTLGTAMNVSLPGAPTSLVAITPDELTIAWYGSMLGTAFYVADRATPSDPFTTYEQREDLNYCALSPDGLRLVAIEGTGRFIEFTRASRSVSFGATPVEGTFATLNADGASQALTFAGCAISPDDRTLFYLASGGQGNQPLHVSTRTGTDPWPVGSEIEGCDFEAHGDLYSHPTGVSADGLTLFFYDWARSQARAAWRETTTGPFVWFKNLGTIEHAQPNTACDRLYSTSPSGPAFSAID